MELDDQTKKIIRSQISNRSLVYFSSQAVPVTFETRILKLTGSNLTLVNSVSPEHICEISKANDYLLQIESLKFHCSQINSDGKNFIFPIKKATLVENNRLEERTRYSDPEKCFCEFINPFDGQTVLKKPIIDLSGAGVSIASHMDSQLFSRGMKLASLKVFLNSELKGTYHGQVVYKRLLMSLKGKTSIQVGIKFM